MIADPLSWLRTMSTYRVTHSWAPNFGYKLVVAALRQAGARGQGSAGNGQGPGARGQGPGASTASIAATAATAAPPPPPTTDAADSGIGMKPTAMGTMSGGGGGAHTIGGGPHVIGDLSCVRALMNAGEQVTADHAHMHIHVHMHVDMHYACGRAGDGLHICMYAMHAMASR